MDILITTGFEKISHAIRFQPETEPKGKKLVDANHVFNVKEHRKEGQSFLIEACVLRQASVSSAAYITKLCIDAVRTVRSVSCTCVYNRSERCKHVAALIYYINNEQSLTKTDKEQEWGKPTARQLAKSKYSKGKNFFEMYPPQPKLQIKATPIEVNMSELNEPSGLRMTLLEGMKRKTDRTIPNLMDSMLNEVEIMQQREDCEICVNTFFILNEKQATYTTDPILSVKLEEFYNKFIVKTKNEVMKLCCDTLEQSKCQSWFEARKLRISASSNAHCIKRRIRKPVESVVAEMLNPIFFETAATKYGRDNESVAAVQYQKVYGTCVKKVGLIVSDKQPWLCASLDGVVFTNNTISKIVEFKCPSSCAKLPIVDFEQKQCNVSYLQIQSGQVQLKKSAQYYTQCQMQMYVSGMNICDLFLYSPVENGSFCVEIHRDEKFLKEVIVKCENFYFQYFLPSLQTKIMKKEIEEKKLRIMETEKTRSFTGNNICNQI